MKNNRDPFVVVSVPVFNRKQKTLRFLSEFKKVEYKNYKIVIVDSGSTDGTVEEIKKSFSDSILIEGNKNLWWSAATNLGVKFGLENKADYILTINDDSLFQYDFLKHLVEVGEKYKRKAIIGSLLYQGKAKVKIWSIGGYMHWDEKIFGLNYEGQNAQLLKYIQNPLEVQINCGNGTLVPSHIFKEIGLYNELWCPQVHGDSEFILRARKSGYTTYVNHNSVIFNDIKLIPDVKNEFELFFSKKSDQYWKPIFYICLHYAPGKYKIKALINRYIPFLSGFIRLFGRKIKNIIKKILVVLRLR